MHATLGSHKEAAAAPASGLEPTRPVDDFRDGGFRSLLVTALQHFARPGKPPARWLALSVLLVAVSLASCALMIWTGHAWHQNAGTYFREGRIGTYLSAGVLAAAGVVSILTGRRAARAAAAAGRSTARVASANSFWIILGALLVYLGLDDMFKIHESIDHAWHRATGLDPKHGPTAKLDNWIVASYGLIAALLFWRHRRYVATLGWFNRTMAAAFVGFAAMVYADTFVFRYEVEDSLKLVSGTLILCAFLAVYFSDGNHVTEVTRP